MSAYEIIHCVILFVAITGVLISLYFEGKTKIVPAPTMPNVRDRALDLIPKAFVKNGKYQVFDLGCGWGGLLVALSKVFPNSKIVGYELSPWPFVVSKVRSWVNSRNIEVYREDFFKKDLSNADIVFCYLSPYHMKQLKDKFSVMKSGGCIISCSFPIPDWEAEEVVYVSNFFIKIPIFYYKT